MRRILRKKFELGLFDDPYQFSDLKREKKVLNDPQHRVAARDVARKSIVLLKNRNKTLPLRAAAQHCRHRAAGQGQARPGRQLDCAGRHHPDYLPARRPDQARRQEHQIRYAKGCEVEGSSRAGFAAAVETAKAADVVVLAVGETWDMSGEAKSRTDIHLPGVQEELFQALKATGKPIVVVLMAGRPLIFNTIADQADAVLYGWFPGSEGGAALADVLFGDYNPGGKLPSTFPRNMGQIPLNYQQYNTGRPVTKPGDIRYKSAYIDAPNTPRYAFGHGLSYTTFKYDALKIDKASLAAGQSAQVQLTVTNTGKAAGEEVVQLYLRDLVASVARPLKELKDFQKISLRPGETKTVTFTLTPDKLAFYNRQLQWAAEPGEFQVMLGSASDDIRLESRLTLLP